MLGRRGAIGVVLAAAVVGLSVHGAQAAEPRHPHEVTAQQCRGGGGTVQPDAAGARCKGGRYDGYVVG